MKKVVAAAAAFLAAVAPCSMFFASIEPVRALAADVTLTPAQTLALFGDKLVFSYDTGQLDESLNPIIVQSYMDFYAPGTITAQTYTEGRAYTVTNSNIIVYRSREPYSNSASVPTVYVEPVVDISNINYFRFSSGFSSHKNAWSNFGDYWDYTSINNTYIKFLANTLGDPNIFKTYTIPYYNYSGTLYIHQVMIETNNTDEGLRHFIGTNIQATVQDYNAQFNVEFERGDITSSCIQQYKYAATPNYDGFADFNSYLYFYVECPKLSDTYSYTPPPDPESSEDESSGDDSGSDYPDYSGDLQDILDKLDAIILQNQTMLSLSSDIENELALANDRLGVGNSKLDQVNSNLNKIDSHLQALQIPDLMSQDSGDMSHIAQNESKNNSDLRAADANQQIINSVAGYGDVSLPNLDNVHSMPDDFSELWNYTDQDGLSWVNPILYAMPILTLTVGALAYIVFGRAR